ncbi:unnamed protein product [Rotaria socialis]|uniref:Uncharacterized protein n=1 Tax=Rotaria socialis TaxID=392032 RepID=A0A821AG25_9BILA|nr:unnamed protein product [Rotaria socialis]CAF4474669.1 unnamed protein product [Rotaria socialis]CAF4579852.1 unnamed protein product [Rotaria socialis]CAF4715643.1 unnamed protein product [Rotaria socialis]
MITVVAMELFITLALEIVEVMSSLIIELVSDPMRYAITTTAHHYHVLQVMFHEISYDRVTEFLHHVPVDLMKMTMNFQCRMIRLVWRSEKVQGYVKART